MKITKVLAALACSLALTGCGPDSRLSVAVSSEYINIDPSNLPVASSSNVETSSINAETTPATTAETVEMIVTTEAEAPAYPVSMTATVNGSFNIGDTLTAANFTITVNMSDGTVLTNPPGFAADPLTLTQASNIINVAYGVLTTTVTVPATDAAASYITAPPKAGNYIVVLDPGHGGNDNGSGNGDMLEKNMTLKVGLACKAYLEAHYDGISVLMTRTEDTRLEIDQTGTDIKARCLYAVNAGADALVSLHFNATGEHNVFGSLGIATADANLRPYAESLSNCILTQIAKLGLRSKGTYTHKNEAGADYYAINRHSTQYGKVGIIIEHCFLDHENDIPYCNSDVALQALGEADARGIAAYFGLTPVR